MSQTPEPGVIELTAEQILSVNSAATTILDAVDRDDIDIEDQFDPIRRDHLEAGRDSLNEVLATLSPEGTWRGRLSPSERQALRDAVGAIEVMLTPPLSERLRVLDFNPDRDDLANLGDALRGIPVPPREDLAFSDVRFGGSIDQLRARTRTADDRTRFDEYNEIVRGAFTADRSAADLRDRFSAPDQLSPDREDTPPNCVDRYVAIVNFAGTLAAAPENTPPDIRSAIEDRINRRIDAEGCFLDIDRMRIRAALSQIVERKDRREDARSEAFAVAEMVAWAESNRNRLEMFNTSP